MSKKIKAFLTISTIQGLLLSIAVSASSDVPGSKTNGIIGSLITFLPLLLVFVAMYFLMVRPQKKKQKQEEELRGSVILGDSITTIGGITGRVVQIKDDEITIESSIDKTLVSFKKWAIREVQKLVTDDAK